MQQLYSYFDSLDTLSPAARQALLTISKKISLRKNELLQPIGHTCKTIYFLNQGLARIYYYKDDKDITESFAFENNILARLESLFTGIPSRKGIQLLEDSQLVTIDARQLFGLYDRFHDIERLMRIITEKAYIETITRIESLQFHTAEERYADLLRNAPDIVKRVPLKYIASYLGITQVSLSRIRALR